MALTLQHKRYTTAELSSITGAAGELIVDTDKDTVTVHDGSTAGGVAVATEAFVAANAGGGTIEATASGALANGDKVVVNADGTVSVVGVSGAAAGITNEMPYNEVVTTNNHQQAVWISNTKFVLAYNNIASGYGEVVVGEVVENLILFGSVTQFVGAGTPGDNATNGKLQLVWHAQQQVFCLAYVDKNDNYYGKARLGLVDGSLISLGGATTFESNYVDGLVLAYDPDTLRILIHYNDGGNNTWRGKLKHSAVDFLGFLGFTSATTGGIDYSKAICTCYDEFNQVHFVGWREYENTVNDFEVRWVAWNGSNYTFTTGGQIEDWDTAYAQCVWVSSVQKTVVVFNDHYNSDILSYRVITRDGSLTVVAGIQTVTGSTHPYWGVGYDTDIGKINFFYATTAGATEVRVGTVGSNSIITFGDDVVLDASAQWNFYNLNNKPIDMFDNGSKYILSYRDAGNNDALTVSLFNNESLVTNLTASNYIGISDGAYDDGATATVQIVGSVDDAQTGLTAGSKYYVQSDGTLALTADDPSVVAGTAISSTSLIVKG